MLRGLLGCLLLVACGRVRYDDAGQDADADGGAADGDSGARDGDAGLDGDASVDGEMPDAGDADDDGGDAAEDGGDAMVPLLPVDLGVGADAYRIAIAPTDPRRLYVLALPDRVFRSNDRGTSWTECDSPGRDLTDLDVHPEIADVVATGSADSLVWSNDGCGSWQVEDVPGGVYSTGFRDSGTILLGTDDGLSEFSLGTGDVTPIAFALGGSTVTAIADDGRAHIAGTNGDGVFVTLDDADTFGAAEVIGPYVYDVAFGPDTALQLAATSNGVYKHTDFGGFVARTGFPVYAIGVDRDGLFALAGTSGGLQMSTDAVESFDGNDLRSTSMRRARVNDLAFDAGDTMSRVYAATGRGVFLDVGRSFGWGEIDNGISAWRVLGMQRAGTVLYMATSSGVLVRTDAGTLTPRFAGMYKASLVSAVDRSPTLLVAAGDYIHVSEDDGVTFARGFDLPFGPMITSTDVVVFDSTAPAQSNVLVSTHAGIMVSNDGATSFLVRDVDGAARDVRDLGYIPARETVMVGTATGVYTTADFGQTYQPWNDGLASRDVLCVANGGGNYYAGTTDGLFFAENFGDPWRLLALTGRAVRRIHPEYDPSTQVLAIVDDEPMISEDGGATWATLGAVQGRPASIIRTSTTIFVGTDGHGLYSRPLP